jgi:hypothetical protein
MKTLSIVIVAVIGLVGCGSSSPNCPEGQIENDQGICVDVPECWGDNDCPTQHACIDFKCILRPECEKDEDCNPAGYGPKMCIDNLCVDYVSQDLCNEMSCTGDCADCGMYTACNPQGFCEDACMLWVRTDMRSWFNACVGIENECPDCNCASQWLMYDRDSQTCKERESICRPSDAPAKKIVLATADWDWTTENRTEYCLR